MRVAIAAILAGLSVGQPNQQSIYDPHQNRVIAPPNHSGEALRMALISEFVESGVHPKTHIQLHRMGDQAAQTVIATIGTRALTERETLNIVDILNVSFEAPKAIPTGPNRTPQATILLLENLEALAQDQTVRDRIITVRNSVLAASMAVTGQSDVVR